jgi:hypothetical protein
MALGHDASTKTLAAMKTDIAFAVGAQGDTEWETEAANQLAKAIEKWQTRRLWSWLRADEEITLTIPDPATGWGDYTYDLNNGFYRPSHCSLWGAPLRFLPYRMYKYIKPDGGEAPTNTAEPDGYSLWNLGSTGKISILPLNSIPDPLDTSKDNKLYVTYWRRIDAGAGTLDMPASHEGSVLTLARGYMKQLKGDDPVGARGMIADGLRAIEDAVRSDVDMPDAEDSFVPAVGRGVHSTNPNSLDVLLQDYGDYY